MNWWVCITTSILAFLLQYSVCFSLPAADAVCTVPDDSSSCVSPWLWSCRKWWSTGNTAGFHAGLEGHDEIMQINKIEVELNQIKLNWVKVVTLTGLDWGCRRSIQSDGFAWFCWLFRGNFWRWIWQPPSHHYLLYVQNPRIHPGTLGCPNRHSQQYSWIQFKEQGRNKDSMNMRLHIMWK